MRKHNHKMATRSLRLPPHQRQNIHRLWSEKICNADIHALMGSDGAKLKDSVGTLIYVLAGAAQMGSIPKTDLDVRIMRASWRVLIEFSPDGEPTELQRSSLTNLLMALRRLKDKLNGEDLLVAGAHVQALTDRRAVTIEDFEALFEHWVEVTS